MNKLTKLFALLLVVALASTTFYVGTQLNSTVSTLGDEQNVTPIDLEVEFDPLHVSLNGESKLHVNVSSVYEAVVSGGSGNFSYAWSVEPVDEKVVFEYSGSTCSFMFVVATVDPYTLSVEVTDLVSGDKAFDSFTVYDPYTLPDLYLESSLADFVCRVKSDGAGWYFVSDGESGKTVFSSTVLLDATDYALSSTTSGNVLLDGVYFDYSLDVPVGVSVTESVDGLVRVFVNEADSQGSPYTISVDTVQTGYYMAQDSMGRFIDEFTSNDATVTWQNTLDKLGSEGGGKLFVNNGQYVVSTLTIPDGEITLEIIGESLGAQLTLADNTNGNLLQYTGATYIYWLKIQNIYFYGNEENNLANGTGIYLNKKVRDCWIQDNFLEKFTNNSIYSEAAWNQQYIGNTIEFSTFGIYVAAGTDAKFLNNAFKYNDYSIYLDTGCSSFLIQNNFIYRSEKHAISTAGFNHIIDGNQILATSYGNNNTYDGIYSGSAHSIISNNIIDGLGSMRAAVNHAGGANLTIRGNTFLSWNKESSGWASVVGIINHPIVSDNVGFTTEKIVSVTNTTSTTFAITTGLSGNVTFASYMFDATTQASTDFKVVSGVQTSATVWTVTVSGTALPASMTCTASFVYKP